jgi:hypothetical protein
LKASPSYAKCQIKTEPEPSSWTASAAFFFFALKQEGVRGGAGRHLRTTPLRPARPGPHSPKRPRGGRARPLTEPDEPEFNGGAFYVL